MMELQLSEANVHVTGPCRVRLPDYMVCLDPAANGPGPIGEVIVAAGLHPLGDVVFMTGDGTLRQVPVDVIERFTVINGGIAAAKPASGGSGIEVTTKVGDRRSLSTAWFLARAEVLLCADVSGNTVTFVDDEG